MCFVQFSFMFGWFKFLMDNGWIMVLWSNFISTGTPVWAQCHPNLKNNGQLCGICKKGWGSLSQTERPQEAEKTQLHFLPWGMVSFWRLAAPELLCLESAKEQIQNFLKQNAVPLLEVCNWLLQWAYSCAGLWHNPDYSCAGSDLNSRSWQVLMICFHRAPGRLAPADNWRLMRVTTL